MPNTYTYPSVLFQGITFTAKQWGKFPTISFTIGGTAGQEVVTVNSTLTNINVLIEDTVTTTAQVIAAIEATSPSLNGNSAGDLVSMVETTPGTVTGPATSSAMSGAVAPNYMGFYADQSTNVLTNTFQAFIFSSVAKFLTLVNNDTAGTNTVVYSWDGINNHGKLTPGASTMLEQTAAMAIFLKYENGAPAYKLMVKTS